MRFGKLVMLFTVIGLVGCQSAAEKKFVQDCRKSGLGKTDRVCSCIYDSLEDKYGGDPLQKFDDIKDLPDDYGTALLEASLECS